MKKIFLALSIMLFSFSIYAIDHISYEIKLKGQTKTVIVYDANIEKSDCTYTDKITNKKKNSKKKNPQ